MASLSYDETNKRWLIQFLTPSGDRKSLTMKASIRSRDKGLSKAAAFKNHIEELIIAARSGTSPPTQVATWVSKLPSDTLTKLVNAGLLDQQQNPELQRLETFLNKWFSDRAGTKQSTVLTWRHVERNLKGYFGDDKLLKLVTEDDAENFERWLQSTEKLGDATRRKRVSIAKQMFKTAIKARLIESNPFSALKTASLANKKRQYFVTLEDTRRVLDACSNAEWRAIVSLGRFAAMRIPSEIRELKWTDVNWSAECLHVHAPKNEHHVGEGDRVVPLFPELRKHLWELHEETADGEIYVLPNIRNTTNVLPTLQRIIARAGMKVWPKAWQNMRASRATELENMFGTHKATEWCGHTEKIAAAHYWMVTADDISKAAATVSDEDLMQSDAYLMQNGCKTTRNGELAPLLNAANSLVFVPMRVALTTTSRARGTRTPNQRIMSSLL